LIIEDGWFFVWGLWERIQFFNVAIRELLLA